MITIHIHDEELAAIIGHQPARDAESSVRNRYRRDCAGMVSTLLALVEPEGPVRQVVAVSDGIQVRFEGTAAPPEEEPPQAARLDHGPEMALEYTKNLGWSEEFLTKLEKVKRANTFMASSQVDPTILRRVYHCAGPCWMDGAIEFAKECLPEGFDVEVTDRFTVRGSTRTSFRLRYLNTGEADPYGQFVFTEGGYLIQNTDHGAYWISETSFAQSWLVSDAEVKNPRRPWLRVSLRDGETDEVFTAMQVKTWDDLELAQDFLARFGHKSFRYQLDTRHRVGDPALLFRPHDSFAEFERVSIPPDGYLVETSPAGLPHAVEVVSAEDFDARYQVVDL